MLISLEMGIALVLIDLQTDKHQRETPFQDLDPLGR